MTWFRVLRSELRKLTTTKLPWAFLAVVAIMTSAVAAAVVFGTENGGAGGFIDNVADQRSLLSFGPNAMMIAAMFGAIATAREYSHGTIVPTFLLTPRRSFGVTAQMIVVTFGGAVLGLIGGGLAIVAGAAAMPRVDQHLLLSAADIAQLLGTAAAAGAVGALFGAGVGVVVRNSGGAAMTVVFALTIVPPLGAQIFDGMSAWVPSTLINVLSGVNDEHLLIVALAALSTWALVPAAIGLMSVGRRDVV